MISKINSLQKHFSEEDFVANERSDRLVLKKDAIPSVFAHSPATTSKPNRRKSLRERRELAEQAIREDHRYVGKSDDPNIEKQKRNRRKLLKFCIAPPLNGPEIEVSSIPSEIHNNFLLVQDQEQQILELKQQMKAMERRQCPCSRIFTSEQLHFLEKGSVKGRGHAWHDSTIVNSLKLMMSCGKEGYSELQAQGFPLPSMNTLQKQLEPEDKDLTPEILEIKHKMIEKGLRQKKKRVFKGRKKKEKKKVEVECKLDPAQFPDLSSILSMDSDENMEIPSEMTE